MLLSKDFIRLVLIAFVLAAPIAYYMMRHWLSDFSYHVDIGWEIFAVSGIAAVIIAWLTVSYQSVRAALMNPAKSLRSE
jgi:putative ABC transport system permease protein